jgi:hypothetical protein
MYYENTLKRALKIYGEEAQRQMMIKEISELTKAICKLSRVKSGEEFTSAVNDIREEMADVQIMLDQMKMIYGEPSDYIRQKIARLHSRLEDKKIQKQPLQCVYCQRETICKYRGMVADIVSKIENEAQILDFITFPTCKIKCKYFQGHTPEVNDADQTTT